MNMAEAHLEHDRGTRAVRQADQDTRDIRAKRCGVVTVLMLLLTLAAQGADAQNQIMRGSIAGQVTDAQALAVPGTTVQIVNLEDGVTQMLVSDGEGRYAQFGLNPGTYRVEATLQGFGEFRSEALRLSRGDTIELDIRLAPAGVAERVTVSPNRAERRTDYSSPSNLITADQIASLNMPTTEDVVNYQPGIVIRRRYIGDSNGTLGMRGANMFQTARSMVFSDGVPLHNPLQTRWNGAPRWSLVSPDEIESAEVIYGPFSAEYSGNAMGGVVKLNTRLPDTRQLRIDSNLFSQGYSSLGAGDTFNGGRISTSYGDRVGRVQFHVLHNHLRNDSQPQNFSIDESLRDAAGQPVALGAISTVNDRSVPSIVYGDTGAERAQTDLFKAKVGVELSPHWTTRVNVAFENRIGEGLRPTSYLTDAAGNTIWGDGNNGTDDAAFSGQAFNVDNALFGTDERDRESLFGSWELNGELRDNWRLQTTVSRFDVLKDFSVESNFNPADPLDDGTGTITEFDDSGWTTLDVKLRDADFAGTSKLSVIGGYHYSTQQIGLNQYASASYRTETRDARTNSSGGATSIQGLFAQLGWLPHPDWEVTLGGRQELWRSRDGFVDSPGASVVQPERDISKFSPKVALGWEPATRFRLQYSLAKAYRFPLPEELFDNEIRTFGTVLGDARLDPEDGIHNNVSMQYGIGNGHVEVNLFRDDVKNTIFTQFQFVGGRPIFSFLPIDKVRTAGVEFVVDQRQVLDSKLDIQVNGTVLDSEIVEHSLRPSNEGKNFPRLPTFRLGLFGIYHFTPRWQSSVGVRYSSNQFDDLDNGDTATRVFGAIDEYFFLDAKITYWLPDGGRLSVGMNNITNEEAFVHHPWPQRTFLAEFSVDVLNELVR
jgi:iron complex outermembrane receptor protein|tara:strand:+ start:722 stop:3367 length:2646 start_codon:yes stop_codon:yes gene_type:complete